MQNIGKLVAWFTFILGAILFLGGIYAAAMNTTAEAQIGLFGQKMSSTSVGVSLAFLGAVLVIVTFRRVLTFASKMPAIVENKSLNHISVVVHEAGDQTVGIGKALVTLLLSPEPQERETDNTGSVRFFFSPALEGKEFWLNARKDDYQARKPKKVSLKNGDLYFIDLKRNKPSISVSKKTQSDDLSNDKGLVRFGNSQMEIAEILSKYAIVDHEKLFGIEELSNDIKEYLLDKNGSWIISLFGEGGVGKTALAYEVAKQYAVAAGFTRFAWVSAKQRYLSITGEVLKRENIGFQWADLIKKTADQMGIETGYARTEWLDDFRKEIRRLPKDERCLLVIDNLETVEDVGVINYLDNPGNLSRSIIKPHKVIITTRKSVLSHSHNVVEVTLKGLKSVSAYELIRFLSRSNKDVEAVRDEELKPILDVTEGNPLLIKLVIRRFLIRKKPLEITLKELKEMKPLTDYLYIQSIKELEDEFGKEASRKLLTAFCPSGPGETLDYNQLYRFSGISDERTFGDILRLACDLSLIRVSGLNDKYSIHSLLWEFICKEE